MTPPVSAFARSLPAEEWKQVDMACDRFEAAWRAGDRPELSSFWSAADVAEPAREALLRELLIIELEFRREAGEQAVAADYVGRFPRHSELIESLFDARNRPGATSVRASLRRGDEGRRWNPRRTAGGSDEPEASLARAELSAAALQSLQAAGYEILGELGRGGMGVVYLARKVALNRRCALKMILAGSHAGRAAAARFRVEAEAVARLRHPGIVQVYHIGEADDLPFLELEYMPGGSLDRAIDGTPWPAGDAARLAERLALAVAEAHRRGIVHRDLKPANILLDRDGQASVADFGLAKILDSEDSLTRTHLVLGTPSYMAPEQAAGDARGAGPATDIYALGALLYELLTGRPPFRAATTLETLELVKRNDPVSPSRLVPGLPRDLETIALKCMDKAPTRRYASARELAEDLRRHLDGVPILARRASAGERAAKWARRRPAVAALALLGFGAASLLIGGGLYYNARLRRSNLDLGDAVSSARSAELRAAASARSAVEQRDLALKALNTLVYEVQDKLGKAPATRPLQRALLDEAIKGLSELARSTASSAPDLSRAEAHLKLATVFDQLGRVAECRAQLEETIGLCDRLIGSGAAPAATRTLEAKALLMLGIRTLNSDRPDEALAQFSRGVALVAEVAPQDPAFEESRPVEMKLVDRIAAAYLWKNDQRQARSHAKKHHGMVEAWAADRPGDRGAQFLLANSFLSLSRIDASQGDLPNALARMARCEEICRVLLAADPTDEKVRDSLHVALNNHAIHLFAAGEFPASLACLEEARRLFLEVEASDRDNRAPQLRLAQVEKNLGYQLIYHERFAEAEAILRASRDRLTRLDRAGNLDDQRGIKTEVLPSVESLLRYCQAAQRVLAEPQVADQFSSDQAASLLAVRVAQLGRRDGVSADLLATVRRLCALDAKRVDDLLSQAAACADCATVIDRARGGRPLTQAAEDARRLCRARALAALDKAISLGFANLRPLEVDVEFKNLRENPTIRALIARQKAKAAAAAAAAGTAR